MPLYKVKKGLCPAKRPDKPSHHSCSQTRRFDGTNISVKGTAAVLISEIKESVHTRFGLAPSLRLFILATLISNRAGCLACRLARCLTLAASAFFSCILQIFCCNSLYSLHNDLPFLSQ